MIENILEGIDVKLGVDYLEDRDKWNSMAKKIVYTGPIDAFYDYSLGTLEYRSIRFENEILDQPNFQGNAAVNYTDCFKDDSWIQLLNDMKNFGIHGPESVQFVGANAKMNEFQAAMGICNLKHLDEEIEKRKHVVEHYRSRLEGVEGIKLSIIQKDVESNYAYFPVVFDGYKYTRNEIFEKLVEVGIGARKYFYPLTNSFECYRNYPTAGAEKTPIAQHIALRVLTLPLYADLSLKDVDRICDVILG